MPFLSTTGCSCFHSLLAPTHRLAPNDHAKPRADYAAAAPTAAPRSRGGSWRERRCSCGLERRRWGREWEREDAIVEQIWSSGAASSSSPFSPSNFSFWRGNQVFITLPLVFVTCPSHDNRNLWKYLLIFGISKYGKWDYHTIYWN